MRRPLAVALLSTFVTQLSPAAPSTHASPHRPTVVSGSLEPIADLVRVGPEGAEWALPGGASLIASPGAELRVIGKPQPLDLGGRLPLPAYTVVLKRGLVRVRVPVAGKCAVVVAAPRRASVLVASGETSVVAASKVAVANASGKASVVLEGRPQRVLPAGTMEILDDGGATRRPLLASPKSLSGTLVLVSLGANVGLGELGWDAIAGAAGYRVELREASSDRLHLRKETSDPRLAAGVVELAPGAYRLRLVALDDTGIESAHPLDRALHVVSVALPDGGYSDSSGALRLPVGSRVSLSHTEGVEMADAADDRYGKSAGTLALPRAEPRLIRLRPAGGTEGVALWLLPRRARAQVEFEPRAPRWPEQPLEIRVRIQDDSGSAAPSWIEARPKVTVGVEPVAVSFAADGAWLRGVLKAHPGKGPWVVRVEVEDQNGAELGRDFIEVAND